MPEYIERAELMKFPIRIDHYDKEHGNVNFVYGVETVLEYAKNIPAADVVPVVHGRWERHPQANDIDPVYVCNLCKLNVSNFEMRWMNYCPNCGARMDGDGNG